MSRTTTTNFFKKQKTGAGASFLTLFASFSCGDNRIPVLGSLL